MFNLRSQYSGRLTREIRIALAILITILIGTYLILSSHASTPYASINADTGNLGNGATIQSNAFASDGKDVQFGFTITSNSEAQVPVTPDVPASENPSGGWTLEYGDAFGSPSLEKGGQDNTYFPNNSASCATNNGFEQAQEIENFSCNQLSTSPSSGLTLTCSYGAPPDSTTKGPAINYDCGAALAAYDYQPSNAYKAFSWKDPTGSSNTIAVQWEWQLPPDYQFDPAIWGTGSYTGSDASSGDEIDNIEAFGWGQQASGGGNNDTAWTDAPFTMPTSVGTSTNNYLNFAAIGLNPTVMHTYTVVYNGSSNTYQSYIDSNEIAHGTLTSNGPEYQSEIWSMAMRGGSGWGCKGACSDPVPGFTSGSHSLVIRYVGYYEDTAHAGQNVEIAGCPGGKYPCSGAPGNPNPVGTPPLIAPGTTVESSSVTAANYQQINNTPS
jgi:hypothetical protein